MKTFIEHLLQGENISAVISSTAQSYRDLSVLNLIYSKDNLIHVARSYYTGAWAAPTPLGLSAEPGQFICMETIYDVADVCTFASLAEAKRYSQHSGQSLEKIYSQLDEHALLFSKRILGRFSSVLYKSTFSFLPYPMVVMSLSDQFKFLGTIGVTMRGDSQLINYQDNITSIILQYLKQQISTNVYKEFSNVF